MNVDKVTTGLATWTKSLYKFHTSNTAKVPSTLVSKKQLLRTNLHEFLCIDRSFSETVFYSFSGNLVEAARQPVLYHCKGSCLTGVLKSRDVGCKQTHSVDHKRLQSCMCAVCSLRSADCHCCVFLSCLKSMTADFISDCVRILR